MIEVSDKEPRDNVSITMPIYLLANLDYHCREHELDRSRVISEAVRMFLGYLKTQSPSFWKAEYHRMQDEGKI